MNKGTPRTFAFWGMVFLTVTITWIFIEKWMGWHSERIAERALYTIIYDVLFFGIFLGAFLNQTKRDLDFRTEWRNRVRFGLGLTLIVTALSPLVQFTWHRWISPEFFPNVIKLLVDNGIMSREDAITEFNLRSYIRQNLIGTFLLGLLCTSLLSIFIRKRRL